MEKYRPFPVDEHVSGAVLYKDDPHSLTLPHMAGEWNGRGEDVEEARLQSAYDGCALLYARKQALSVPSEEEEGKMEYHQSPIASMNLTNSYEEFKKGRKQLRHLQDHGRGQSYALRGQLEDQWKAKWGAAPSVRRAGDDHDIDSIPKEPLPIPPQENGPYSW